MKKRPILYIAFLLLGSSFLEKELVPNTSGIIDLNNLYNYANQSIPDYITKDNNPLDNPLTNEGATLGRVLFYDNNLSINDSISCASCHLQEFAFSDTAAVSTGVNGTTARHSMRLINTRFGEEIQFFWDERAETLEAQTTMPIQDHIEMGFSGEDNDPSLDSLVKKLESLEYYQSLFSFVFGDPNITEDRIQKALAQFIRSIQSFDSKFDLGRAQTATELEPFSNFTIQENNGKALFLELPQFDFEGNRTGGGAGCNACHQAPEFDIDPFSKNNGIVGAPGGGLDFTNTRAPSLRDVLNQEGEPFGGFMHNAGTGIVDDLTTLISFYNELPSHLANEPFIGSLDPRLVPNGHLQHLHLTEEEKGDLIAFLKTLTGSNVYSDIKWSNPFIDDSLTIIPIESTNSLSSVEKKAIQIFPNPAESEIFLEFPTSNKEKTLIIYNISGQIFYKGSLQAVLNISNFPSGLYFLKIENTVYKFYKK